MSMFSGDDSYFGRELAGCVPINRLVTRGELAAIYVLGARFHTKQAQISAAVCWRDENLVAGDGLPFGLFQPAEPGQEISMVMKLPDGRVIDRPWPISQFRPGHGLRVHVTWQFEPPIPTGLIRIECAWGYAGLPAAALEIESGPLIESMLAARPVWQPPASEP